MKTLTEFTAVTLKNAAQTKKEVDASGKTAEELPAALAEALKVEGDKLTYLLGALELVGEKTHDLKRVIVQALNEGEKAPTSGARLIGEKYYSVEYYQSAQRAAPAETGRDGKHGGKRGGKPGDKRGGGRPGEKRGEGRGPGGDRGPGAGGGGGRGPRPAQTTTPRPAGAGPVVIKPLSKPIA